MCDYLFYAAVDVTDEPSLMAGGPDHTLVDCCMRGRSHVGLGTFDTFRLLADVGDSISRTAHIAEVSEEGVIVNCQHCSEMSSNVSSCDLFLWLSIRWPSVLELGCGRISSCEGTKWRPTTSTQC